MNENYSFYRSKKIILTKDLSKLINQNLVFTSGVFDLIHHGHINFFREAKNIVRVNGKLVVATHDDESIKLHKGSNRPLFSLEKRLDFLTELESIDYVIAWHGWENITELALELKPKYFAVTTKSYEHSQKGKWKGSSWEAIAEKINAEIVKIKLTNGISTTKLENILKNMSD